MIPCRRDLTKNGGVRIIYNIYRKYGKRYFPGGGRRFADAAGAEVKMLEIGKNAVNEALEAGANIEKLCVQKDLRSDALSRIVKKARERGIKIVFTDKAWLDKNSGGAAHQGVIAVSSEYRYYDLAEALEEARAAGKRPFILLLDGIEDPHNLGAVIRVADCAGVDAVVVPKHRGCGVTDAVSKTSAGAVQYVKVAKVTNINDAVRYLKDEGVTVFAADADGQPMYSADLTGDLALIIGGEGKGVHMLTKKLADGVIAIPQFGQVNSLNASVAAGVLAYEAVRQRGKE